MYMGWALGIWASTWTRSWKSGNFVELLGIRAFISARIRESKLDSGNLGSFLGSLLGIWASVRTCLWQFVWAYLWKSRHLFGLASGNLGIYLSSSGSQRVDGRCKFCWSLQTSNTQRLNGRCDFRWSLRASIATTNL